MWGAWVETSMYDEKEYFPLSALQHMIFCKRQCALIHVEQLWLENRFTAEGCIMHERVDRGDASARGRVRIEYSLPLKSTWLGVTGKADAVEFHKQIDGKWLPFPVEYKRGKPKKDNSDKVQLCAQAICLEEMTGARIESGALFYGKTRRRLDVTFTNELRNETLSIARELHQMLNEGKTPKAQYSKKCDSCSFFKICMPKTLQKKPIAPWGRGLKQKEKSVAGWIKKMIDMEADDL